MKKGIIIVLLVIVILSLILKLLIFSSLHNNFLPRQREQITFLKFVSSENCMYSFSEQEIKELRELGVNGIRICPLYRKENGEIKEDLPSSIVVNLIRKAHDAGFAVFLEVNVINPRESTTSKQQNDLYNVAVYWAKIAEKEKVEFYSPLNEPDLVFGSNDLLDSWIGKLKNLKSFFSGNLVLKFSDIGPEKIENISACDYLAFDIMWSNKNYQDFKNHLKRAVEKGNSLKEQYNLKGFFFGELGVERARVNKSTQTQIFKIIAEETRDKVDGYCFLGWSNLEFKFKDNEEAKKIIKELYQPK